MMWGGASAHTWALMIPLVKPSDHPTWAHTIPMASSMLSQLGPNCIYQSENPTLWILKPFIFGGPLNEPPDSLTLSTESAVCYFQRSAECVICTHSVKKINDIFNVPSAILTNLLTSVTLLGQVLSGFEWLD